MCDRYNFREAPPGLVSVIVPCYNAEKWLQFCLSSIRKQDYPNIEIIVVDDGSTDGSAEIAENNPVTLIRNGENRGECETTERGFAAAKGDYLCRLSADDEFISPRHISHQVNAMIDGNLDWCYNIASFVGASVFDPDLRIQKTSWCPLPYRILPGPAYSWWFNEWMIDHPNLCYLIAAMRNPINCSALMFDGGTYRQEKLSWGASTQRGVCDAVVIGQLLGRGLRGGALPYADVLYRKHPDQATKKQKTIDEEHRVRMRLYNDILIHKESPFWMKVCAHLLLLVSDTYVRSHPREKNI